MRVEQQKRQRITCAIDGRTYAGTYWVAGSILVVSTPLGGASNVLTSREPEALAAQLLRKLVRDGKAEVETAVS